MPLPSIEARVQQPDIEHAICSARVPGCQILVGVSRLESLTVNGDRKIVQFHLSMPIPNELLAEFVQTGAAGDPGPFTRPLSRDDLVEDFLVLRRTLESWHPALYRYETRADVDRAFDAALRDIKEPMTALQFETLITPVIARAHCVHTRILPTEESQAARASASTFLPGEVQVIGDRLYLCRNYSDSSELLPGAEILGINGRPAGEILERLLSMSSSDGFIQSHKLSELNDGFAWLYAVHIESPPQFRLELVLPGVGGERLVDVPALSYWDFEARRRERGSVRPPDPKQDLETTILADEDTAILALHTFRPANLAGCVEELSEFFLRLREEQVGNLILDLRRNTGGEPALGLLLVSYLANARFTYFALDCKDASRLPALWAVSMSRFYAPYEPAQDFFQGERILVLIGGRCTSTCGHVLSLLKHQGRSMFIGQESGATFTCNDNSRDLTLPNTGIQVHIARNTFRTPVTGLPPGRGIVPDYPVQRALQQVLNGVDVELDRARRLIREGR